MFPERTNPLPWLAPLLPLGRCRWTSLRPFSLGSPCSRSPPAGGVAWACTPRGGAGAEPPGGARRAETRPAVARSPETPLLPAGYQSPEPPSRCARPEQRAPGGRGRRNRCRPRASRVGPPGHAESPPGVRPRPAARPQPGWGDRLVQVSGPRVPPPRLPPAPVNYAGGWHRRAQVAQVSLATFARASLLPAARQRSRAQAPPQGGGGSGRVEGGGDTHRALATRAAAAGSRARRCDPGGRPCRLGPGDAGRSECPHGGSVRRMGARARGRGSCFQGAGGVQRGRGRSHDRGLSRPSF